MEIQQKHIPQLRFPEFLNDGEWEVKRLGEIAESFTGLTYSPEQVVENGGTLVLRSSNIKNGVLSFEDNVYVQMDIPERAITHIGDLLICVRNGSKNLIGKSAVITKEAENTAFGAFMTVLRAKEGTDQEFLNFLWQSDMIQNQILRNLGSTINQITSKDLNGYKVIVPPLAEQRRIAACLSVLDEKLAATNGKLEQLKAYKKGLMQKLFPAKGKKLPELRFKEFEKDGGWEEKKLGEITTDIYQPQTISQSQFSADGYPVYGANGIIGYYEFYNHDTDQILVTCRGSSCGTINYSVGKCWITGNAMVINLDRVLCHYDKRFVYYMLLGMDLSKLVTGSGQPQIVRFPLLNLEVSVTNNINEQRRIVDCLGSIDKMINQYTNKVAFLELYKKGLMQQMFPTSK